MSQDKIESRRAFMKKVVALSGVVAFMTPAMASEKKNKDAKEPEGGCQGTCKGICGFQCDYTCTNECRSTCKWSCGDACTSCAGTCKGTCTATSN